jgi:hypothetical protein
VWGFKASIILIMSFFLLFNKAVTKKVFAGCSGTIYCGTLTAGSCSTGGKCYSAGPCAGTSGPGTCLDLGTQCNESGGAMNCSSAGNQATCESITAADCAIGCSNSADRPCTWSSGGGGNGTPTPTPGGGGEITCGFAGQLIR